MWSDDDNGNDIGYGESPTTQPRNSGSRLPVSITSLPIKHIIESGNDSLMFCGYPVGNIVIVGIVRTIQETTTRIIYTVQDWSGTIQAMLWIEDGTEEISSQITENMYCRIVGTKRNTTGNEPCLVVFKITPINNLGMITMHFLEVIHASLKADRLARGELGLSTRDYGNSASNMTTSNNSQGAENHSLSYDVNFTPHQKNVIYVLSNSHSEMGLSINEIADALQSKTSLSETTAAVEFLLNEGFIYNTIDDQHFKLIES